MMDVRILEMALIVDMALEPGVRPLKEQVTARILEKVEVVNLLEMT